MQGENGDQVRDVRSRPPLRAWPSHNAHTHEGSDLVHSPDISSSQSSGSMQRRDLVTRDSSESITYIIPGTQSAFVTKLYNIVGDEDIQHLVSWSKEGDIFSVKNPTEFARTILPQYFKHNNWQSFVRQLNMYGFHKVNDVFHTVTNEQQLWEFAHDCFRRGQPELLQRIKRKTGARLSPAQVIKSDSPGENADLTDERLRHLEQQIFHLQSKCETIMKINTDMRQTQMQQQEIIQQLTSKIREDTNVSPSQPQPTYTYDSHYPRRSSNEDRSPSSSRAVGPSLLRNNRFTPSSQSDPYTRYTDRPGGESPSTTAMETTDTLTTLPPILRTEQPPRQHDRVEHSKRSSQSSQEQRDIRDPNGKLSRNIECI
ncbi:hypothetical protein INT43_002456 [Umbelopsis isabellina]|uniref:HSF-type DNA-binding domain-containing protein n=1 Tax=Mortierella isabellina TaxID=91625 RepID=A0A8H7Q519_MORIS|nr:hypothetical protein INT43_002456 [Umbelopsis isabellina]